MLFDCLLCSSIERRVFVKFMVVLSRMICMLSAFCIEKLSVLLQESQALLCYLFMFVSEQADHDRTPVNICSALLISLSGAQRVLNRKVKLSHEANVKAGHI